MSGKPSAQPASRFSGLFGAANEAASKIQAGIQAHVHGSSTTGTQDGGSSGSPASNFSLGGLKHDLRQTFVQHDPRQVCSSSGS